MTRCPRCGAQESRSTPQLRRFFAVVKAAFHQWPESHRFRPHDSHHLRKWLQCAAGHMTIHHVEIPEGASAAVVAGACRSVMEIAGGYAFVQVDGDRALNVVIPKSIDYRRLSHRDACRLFQEVEDVIKAEIGIDPEALLKEHERAA